MLLMLFVWKLHIYQYLIYYLSPLLLELIPAVSGQTEGYTPDKLPAHHRTFTPTGNLD